MALIFLESWDAIDTATEGSSHVNFENYTLRRSNAWQFGGGSGPELFSDYAFGNTGMCMMFGDDSAADNNYIEPHAMNGHATYICGIAINPGLYLGADFGSEIVHTIQEWKNLSDGKTHMSVRMVDARHLLFERGTSYVAHVRNVLRPGIWNYLEVKITCSNTVGVIEVQVNGEEVLNETGLDTNNGGATDEFDTIRLKGIDGGNDDVNTYFDDWYICDGSGSNNNDFLGPIKIESLLPDADGTYQEWNGYDNPDFSPTNHFDLVNAVPLTNDDDKVVYTATSGDKDTYEIDDLSLINGTIFGIKLDFDGRNAGGSDTFKALIISNTDESASSAITIPTSTYGLAPYAIFETDPQGGGAFTAARINALESGVEK